MLGERSEGRKSLVRFAETTSLFNLSDVKQLYGHKSSLRTIYKVLGRLKKQGRVRGVCRGVFTGTLSREPVDRFQIPGKLRQDAVVAFHSALEYHGAANQVFRTVYYFSERPRRDVVFDGVTFHQVAAPLQLSRSQRLSFQVKVGSSNVRVTARERSLVDCLLFLEYSGGVDELDRSVAMFPSFDFELALEYLRLLKRPWLYSRLGYLLDRHAERLFFRGTSRDAFLRRVPSGVVYLEKKRPGLKWVRTWNVMVPPSLTGGGAGRTNDEA